MERGNIAFAMAIATSADEGEEALDNFILVPEEQYVLDDKTTGLDVLNLVDEGPPGESVAALPADETQPTQPKPRGTKRLLDGDHGDADDCRSWCKRTSANKPDGIDEQTWKTGVSQTEIPGWTKLFFMHAPPESWQTCERWVHPTTISDDVKRDLSPILNIRHNKFYFVGMNSQRKLPFTELLTQATWENPDPLEHRVCVPTSLRLFPLLDIHGMSDELLLVCLSEFHEYVYSCSSLSTCVVTCHRELHRHLN